MTILCIETSTSVCSAAICKDGELLKQCICHSEGSHAQLLPRYIEELLAFSRTQHLVLDAVALSEGPGSYTGLRIGTSTAKGLCYGFNIPLIPVPTLELLNLAARDKGANGMLVPMIDARRMEVYTTDNNGKARAVVVEDEQSLYAGDETVYYFGDGAAKCQAVLTKPNWHFLPDIVPEARYLGVYVETVSDYTPEKAVNLAYYEPYYLKEFVAAQSHVKGLKS